MRGDGIVTYSALIESLKRLLRVHINTGQPAAKTRVGVIPAHNHFGSAGLLQHVKHDRLVNIIHRLYTDTSAVLKLRHAKNSDANQSKSCITAQRVHRHTWGMAKTSTHVMVYSSTKDPSIRPMTSIGMPARPVKQVKR